MKTQNSYTLGNLGINTLKIEFSEQETVPLSIKTGWNLVSMPLNCDNMSVSSLFQNASSPVYAYGGVYNSVQTLEPLKGYWVKYNSNYLNNICGNVVTPNQIPLSAGWNMIGIKNYEIAASQLTTTPANIISSPFYSYDGVYVNSTALQPGKGYWIKASQSGVLNLPAQTPSGKITAVSRSESDKWGKIIFTDKSGQRAVLYVSNEKIESSKYELPPVPPGRQYDVRYESNNYVEMLNGNRQYIRLSGVEYPLKIKTEGIDVLLKDRLTGSLFNVALTKNKECTLENESIEQLAVEQLTMPQKYELSQNYPNPFNPETTIRYALPEETNVKLSIFNLLGQKIAEPINGKMTAGYHELKWTAGEYSSGVYIYKLEAGSYNAIKKMMIVK